MANFAALFLQTINLISLPKFLKSAAYTNTFLPSLFTESFWNLAPDCLMVLVAEFVVDWIKHAFITRFNEVSSDVYKNYTIFLAYDLAQTKQKHVSK